MARAALDREYNDSRTWWGCTYFRQAMAKNRFQSFEYEFFKHNLRDLIQTNIPQLTTNLRMILSALFAVMKYHRNNHSDGRDLCPSCLCLAWSNLQEEFQGIMDAVIAHAQKEKHQWEPIPDFEEQFEDLFQDRELIDQLKDQSEVMFGSACCDVETDIHSESARETPPPKQLIKLQQPEEESKSRPDLIASNGNQNEADKFSNSASSSSSPAPSLSTSPSLSFSEQRFQSAFQSNPPSLLLTQISNKKLLNQDRAYLQKSWNSWVDYAFDQHDTPRKFKFENIDVIESYGRNSVSISFFERPKKTLLSFFARRLEKNRSCRIKVFSRKQASTRGKSNPTTATSPPRTSLRQQSFHTSPKQPASRFTPTTTSFQHRFPSPNNFPTPLFHNHNHPNSSGNSNKRSHQSFTRQTNYVTQEQFAQIQSQLNFLTSLFTECPCAPKASNF